MRVVERIENGGAGLNLTFEVRDGILNHTGDLQAETCEGRIVGTADRIAYVNHDIDDAIRAGILREADLPDTTHRVLGANHSARIETLVTDMVRTSAETGGIAMSPEVWDAMMELRAFLFENVYTAPSVMAEVEKAKHLLADLFDYYAAHIDEVPEDYRAISEGDDLRAVTDYIAGMTDRYATGHLPAPVHPPRPFVLEKAAALLQLVQLVGARDGAEAAGAEAHPAMAAKRLVDDGHGARRRKGPVGAHFLAGSAATAQVVVYDVVGLAHRLSFAPRCGCRRPAPNRVGVMSRILFRRRCQCSRSRGSISTGQQRMKADAIVSMAVRYACSATASRSRRESWKGSSDGKSRGRRRARGAHRAVSGEHPGGGARVPHAPWHVRALHQGAFGLRRRRHDRRQRVEPHHAGAGGGRGRARAGVGAGCRGLSRRHAAAFGHRPLHAASARGLRRAGGARHHVEEAHR